MELLALVSDVDNTVSLLVIDTVSEGSHVGGVIVEATIRLLNDQGDLLLWDEEADGALVLHSDASLRQLSDHRTEHGVVERLTDLGQSDVETIVDLLELFAREVAQHLPTLSAVLVARLQLDDIGMGSVLELLIRVEALLGILVEALKVSDLGRGGKEVGEVKIELSDEHAELGTPVTHVVHTENIMSLELKDAANTVSLDSGAQVTHMHVLGDVWRGEVNQNARFFAHVICSCRLLLLFFLIFLLLLGSSLFSSFL